MADNNNTESFALGIVVAVILYLFFRRELNRFVSSSGKSLRGGSRAGGAGSHGGAGGTGGSNSSGCGCGGLGSGTPSGSVISIGGESYSGFAS